MLHTAIIEGRQQLRGDETLVDVRNPATGEVLAALGWASPSTLVEAIDAAEAAAKAWTQTLAKDRELILLKAAEAVERRRARIVDLLTTETGSTLAKAHWEVAFVINMLRSAAGECRRIFGDTLPLSLIHI